MSIYLIRWINEMGLTHDVAAIRLGIPTEYLKQMLNDEAHIPLYIKERCEKLSRHPVMYVKPKKLKKTHKKTEEVCHYG